LPRCGEQCNHLYIDMPLVGALLRVARRIVGKDEARRRTM
jgi:hypothetical protein